MERSKIRDRPRSLRIEVPALAGTAAFGCRVEMPQIALWTGPAGRIALTARILDQGRRDQPIRARVDALYSIGQVIRALLDRVARTGAVASVASSRVRFPTECNPKRGDGMSLIDLSGERQVNTVAV